ncbi:MAG: HD domain-containing protein [Chloroflexi bacterium]|nr:HD domain-containing protein [Chloroflexota bacterium]
MYDQVPETIRVLQLEDNPADARLVKIALAESRRYRFELVQLDRLSKTLEYLAGGNPDIVLLDLSLPDAFGLDVVAQTRAVAPGVPIVVMSSLGDEDMALKALQEGAQDYLFKGAADSSLLVRSMLYAIQRRRSEDALRGALEESRHRGSEISALLESARAVLDARDFREAAQSIFGYCRSLTGATAGYISVSNGDQISHGRDTVFLELGDSPCAIEGDAWCPAGGLAERVYRTGRAIVKNGIADDEFEPLALKGHMKLDNVLFAPLGIEGKVVGLLGLANKPGGFTDNDARMATALGELAAIAYHNHRALERLQQAMEGTIRAIALTVEMRDPYTAGHQQRVAQLAVAIATEIGLTEEQVQGIRLAATIHDLGKIHVPAEILSKPSRLTAIEYNMIKTHPDAGFDILKTIDFPWPIAQIVLQHHERMDGSGYPHGLQGEDILLEARIVAVADTVEAMASHRPYRPTLGVDKALAEIATHRGVLYDPAVVDACLRLFAGNRFQLAESFGVVTWSAL